MFGLQPWHLIILAVVFALLFGAKRIPASARAWGQAVGIVKRDIRTLHEPGPGQSGAPTRIVVPPTEQAAAPEATLLTPTPVILTHPRAKPQD